MDIKIMKKQARVLQSLGHVKTLSSALDLVAVSHGFSDWNTGRAKTQNTYFARRHANYCFPTAEIVRAFSQACAIQEDLVDIRDRFTFLESPILGYLRSMRRAIWQVDKFLGGELKASPSLQALVSGSYETYLSDPPLRLSLVAAHVSKQWAFRSLQSSGEWATDEKYSKGYLVWQLNKLWQADARRKLKSPSHLWHELLLSGEFKDPYDIPAWSITRALPDKDLVRNLELELTEIKGCAKANFPDQRRLVEQLMLCLILPSATPGIYLDAISDPDAVKASWDSVLKQSQRVLVALPEIALWQAWLDLKPLLCPEADEIYAEALRRGKAV